MTRAVPALAAAVLVLTAAGVAPAYRTGAPTGFTGGFGEPHCGTCHFGDAATGGAGGAAIQAPAHYRPGETYDITVSVRHPELEAGGFQLSARFAGGDRDGAQAGRLEPADPRTQVATGAGGITYAGHSLTGALPAEPGVGRWTLLWTAPESGDPVVLHLAANAANDDDSEFGDRIFLAHQRIEPGPPPCP
jgi:hypothetical protein